MSYLYITEAPKIVTNYDDNFYEFSKYLYFIGRRNKNQRRHKTSLSSVKEGLWAWEKFGKEWRQVDENMKLTKMCLLTGNYWDVRGGMGYTQNSSFRLLVSLFMVHPHKDFSTSL